MAVDLCNSVDCGRAPPAPVPAPAPMPGVDLMAKDYDSLLRVMLDLLPARAPGWVDRIEADLGMALLELFAYCGDQLSYVQDRVALEGFLRTAAQYESVRKLLRLVDYSLYPGHAASADLAVEAEGNAPLHLPAGFKVSSAVAADAPAVVFETDADAVVVPALSRASLAADAPSNVAGDELILATIDTDRMTAGTRLLLQSGSQREIAVVATRVIGAAATTVRLAAPLKQRFARGGAAPTRVNGNLVGATHGETVFVNAIGTGERWQSVGLELAPLTYVLDADGAARSTLRVAVDMVEHKEVEDFVDSKAADAHYRLTRGNDGYPTIHFGDGAQGRAPARDAAIRIRYRVGIGDAGRVAADALTVFEARPFPDPSQRIRSVRNPFAAGNPAEPESLAAARLLGPRQLARQERCVTARDFEALALGGVKLNGIHVAPLLARATFKHTGSWTTAIVSLDLPGHAPLAATPGLREAFRRALAARKLAGLDVRVEDARYAPLSIALHVEVRPEYFAREVRDAILAELIGDQPTSSGALPFFAHRRFNFGQAVRLSDLYAAASGVAGVLSLAVTRFKRLGDRHPDREAAGFIEVGELELARCDNDPAHTENGVLIVRTSGGKEG